MKRAIACFLWDNIQAPLLNSLPRDWHRHGWFRAFWQWNINVMRALYGVNQ